MKRRSGGTRTVPANNTRRCGKYGCHESVVVIFRNDISQNHGIKLCYIPSDLIRNLHFL